MKGRVVGWVLLAFGAINALLAYFFGTPAGAMLGVIIAGIGLLLLVRKKPA